MIEKNRNTKQTLKQPRKTVDKDDRGKKKGKHSAFLKMTWMSTPERLEENVSLCAVSFNAAMIWEKKQEKEWEFAINGEEGETQQ